MKKTFTLLAVAFVALLTACSPISSGTITDKTHYAGYHSTTYMCASYNAQGMCSVQVPITTWNPDTFKFNISQDGEDGWVMVSESTYNDYEIGDYFSKK